MTARYARAGVFVVRPRLWRVIGAHALVFAAVAVLAAAPFARVSWLFAAGFAALPLAWLAVGAARVMRRPLLLAVAERRLDVAELLDRRPVRERPPGPPPAYRLRWEQVTAVRVTRTHVHVAIPAAALVRGRPKMSAVRCPYVLGDRSRAEILAALRPYAAAHGFELSG